MAQDHSSRLYNAAFLRFWQASETCGRRQKTPFPDNGIVEVTGSIPVGSTNIGRARLETAEPFRFRQGRDLAPRLFGPEHGIDLDIPPRGAAAPW